MEETFFIKPLEILMMSQKGSFREPFLSKPLTPAIPEPRSRLRDGSLQLRHRDGLGGQSGGMLTPN